MAIYEPRVEIRLDRARTARAFAPRESLWIPELERIAGLIEEQLIALSERGLGQRLEDLPLLAMAIFGTYGSGKTSLLMTLRGRVNQRYRGDQVQADRGHTLRDAFESIQDKVYSLPVIKPNVVSRHDNFLYAFLATALAEVYRLQDKTPTGDARARRQASPIPSPVHQAFHEVSEYLQVIDEPEKKEYDPLGVSLERLERHASDIHLREKLGSLIEALASYFTHNALSSVLLLPIDDADLAADTLVNVLNTYRRYLEHPQLVPVFTFTGRMAEDLVTAHLARELKVHDVAELRARDSAEPGYSFQEQMALQHLAKLFPVRNRIRLGPAPARVQAATFKSPFQPDGEAGKPLVLHLLQTASRLLFGHAEWPVAPSVRLALRPSSLRRQIQVLDAMYAANVDQYMPGSSPSEPSRPTTGDGGDSDAFETSWVVTFENAGWSLLNAHRDALREYDFYLDDLYGWTPQGLREVALSTLLSLDLDLRRKLLRRWHYCTEDRRSQILSLLAMIVFRPRLRWEEATGDDPDAILEQLEPRGLASAEEALRPADKDGLPVEKGFLWFFHLWVGFYLPQVLAFNRTTFKPEPQGSNVDRVRGVGWDLRGGPAQAIREALNNQEICSTGMLFVDPRSMAAILEPESKDDFRPEVNLLARLWCYYGFEGGLPWAAVSLWRGLGFICQLLSQDNLIASCRRLAAGAQKGSANGTKGDEPPADREIPDEASQARLEEERRDLKRTITRFIYKHLEAARIPGSMRKPRRASNGYGGIRFATWSETEEDPSETDKERQEKKKRQTQLEEKQSLFKEKESKIVQELASKIVEWLGKEYPLIRPMSPLDATLADSDPEPQKQLWQRCFTRRLQGEYLLGSFWSKLTAAYFDRPDEAESAVTILSKWIEQLLAYFQPRTYGGNKVSEEGRGGDAAELLPIVALLKECPLLNPFDPDNLRPRFLDDDNYYFKAAKGDAPGLKSLQEVQWKHSPFVTLEQDLQMEGKLKVPSGLLGSEQKAATVRFDLETKPSERARIPSKNGTDDRAAVAS